MMSIDFAVACNTCKEFVDCDKWELLSNPVD